MLSSLRLEEFSDRELLKLVQDHQDEDGYVTTAEIATAIGIDTKHPNNNVGIRFGWLKHYGVVEGHPEKRSTWRLTPEGQIMANGRLKAGQEKTLNALDQQQLLEVTTYLTRQYRTSSGVAAALIGREWRYGTHKLRYARGR